MDQNEIDELFSTGSIKEENRRQEELYQNLKKERSGNTEIPVTPRSKNKQGKVMGQISKVTEESEAGTNLVMNYMEKILTSISIQKNFIQDIDQKYSESPEMINIHEALAFINDSTSAIENTIFDAMDAFQFQDIGRQKLMKVMYTLAKLNEYLNELLGYESERDKTFGREIEKKTLEQDKDKDRVDSVISEFQGKEQDYDSTTETGVDDIVSEFKKADQSSTPPSQDEGPVDVDSIVSEFKDRKD